MRPFALTIFLSAFLLFLVQPLIGKFILPWFGSSPGVWTTALLFFQLLLLAGYAYAHLLDRTLTPKAQALLHLALVTGALLLLPITPDAAWKPDPTDNPVGRILLLLTATVGAPFLLLSATSPLVQAWFRRVEPGQSPYRLYAISNAGSLLALAAYPFAVEPILRLNAQTWVWSGGFVAFAVLVGLCARTLIGERAAREHTPNPTPADSPRWNQVALWLTLSALGSVVLMATMNQLTQNVPAVPFLFVLPLAVYLTTFIIAFDHERWYDRRVFVTLLPAAVAAGFVALFLGVVLDLGPQLFLYAAALFVCCMACHGELARRKPDPSHLTQFYLAVSAGGALGGVFVAVVAPVVFDRLLEYPLGLLAVLLTVGALVAIDLMRNLREIKKEAASHKARSKKRKRAQTRPREKQTVQHSPVRLRLALILLGLGVAGVGVFVGVNVWNLYRSTDPPIARARNFYGTLRVTEQGDASSPLYALKHGPIDHGTQFRNPAQHPVPTAYYGPNSGVGLAILHHPLRSAPGRPFRIGGVGLGVGTLAAYAHSEIETRPPAGDVMRFYEINAGVVDFAERYFTYLEDARARGAEVDVMLGDARLVMERQIRDGDAGLFDVLAVDAFSGDAIPMHLLTAECFDLYLAHLAEGGLLAFHITNRFLDLLPVIRTHADRHRMEARLLEYFGDPFGNRPSSWVIVTDNEAFLQQDVIQKGGRRPETAPPVRWTDDFGSLVQVLK